MDKKTTAPKKNRLHQQNIFGVATLANDVDVEVPEIFEEDSSVEQLKAQKMKMF